MRLPLALGAMFAACSLSVGHAVAPATDETVRQVISAVGRHQTREIADGDYTPVDSLAALKAARAPQGVAWIYPWGVTLYGTLRASEVTGDKAAEAFVLKHNEVASRYYAFMEAERTKLGAAAIKSYRNPISGLLALGTLDSCGAMGTQMLEGILRHGETPTAEEKVVVARIADWIVNHQDRLPDGTLWRADSNRGAPSWKPGTIWLDDLYMACPFLVRWSEYNHDPKALDDAARQVVQMTQRLQDKDGLCFHIYFVNEHKPSPIKWGRANGWAMVAAVEVLSALPPDHPAREPILKFLRTEFAGLKKVQAPSGMWHQVLDHPEIWEETSCTAMFAYSFARAANRGWIDAADLDVARRAFAGIATQVTPEGVVNGTCEGTNIGLDLAFYANRKRPSDDLHGPGVVELAGAEILAARH